MDLDTLANRPKCTELCKMSAQTNPKSCDKKSCIARAVISFNWDLEKKKLQCCLDYASRIIAVPCNIHYRHHLCIVHLNNEYCSCIKIFSLNYKCVKFKRYCIKYICQWWEEVTIKTLISDKLLQREGYHIQIKPKNVDVSKNVSSEFAAFHGTKSWNFRSCLFWLRE